MLAWLLWALLGLGVAAVLANVLERLVARVRQNHHSAAPSYLHAEQRRDRERRELATQADALRAQQGHTLRRAKREADRTSQLTVQRQLRQQQDEDFVRSLAADQAAAATRAAAQAAQEETEALAAQTASQLKALKDNLSPEPAPDAPAALTLALRLPNGQRLRRRFESHQRVQDVLDVMRVQQGSLEELHLVSPQAPDQPWQPSATLAQAGIRNRDLVMGVFVDI
ncbi:uncharacterized protein MONBRDRAFT_25048 [Monosiga brevicollis MX1]|uniref:UBX domain-containing protein n=1 Tax=Monosiga brevicollis TaxID=81824 RepID=A9UXM1_MONBE|nr:uncharacterized protein MONBRDRAFT_25048 [Monosiga brevicollis MX1]EDQ90033.1 predicted protein [Monosiga brevicollis MX1]|eukprot:XP_001745455.1 hypothetical protein [Monosiga brevicollis MX1]